MNSTSSSRLVAGLAAGLAAVVVLSGCAAQIAGAPAGGPGVATSQGTDTTASTDVLEPQTDVSVPGPATSPSVPSPSATSPEEPTPSDPTSPPTTNSDPDPSPTTDGQDPDSDPAALEFVSMIARGMSDVTSYRGKISMEMGSAGSITGSMQGTVSGGQAVDSEVNMAIDAGSQSVEVKVLTIGPKIYIGGSALLQTVPEAKGKSWILADPKSSDPIVKQLASSMGSVSTNNISSMVRFASAAKSVEKGDTEEIDGVQTTRYLVVLDPKKLTDTQAGGMAPESTEATFYVDGDDLMRRAVVRVGVMGQKVELTMDMTDYNTDVQIQEPAADTVYTG